MSDTSADGSTFLLRQGRLLERRLADCCLGGAPPSGVIEALRGYQNEDGGFGHGLEPDTRCPASLPIYVEFALQALVAAQAFDPTMVDRAADWLAGVAAEADAGGAVPLAFPVIESFPRADHWTDWTYEPGLNPTAGLVGLLYKLGVDHPFVTNGARYCWEQLTSQELPDDAHALSEVLVFLDHTPERERADEMVAAVAGALNKANFFRPDAADDGYGLSPLNIAPSSGSRWRALFSAKQLGAHLDRMTRDQQADGGWPISWEPPSELAALEWRGIETLRALRTLTSYGRLEPRP
ncbi:MAG: hypothetical protein ACLPQS_04670 [Acidimicrobiales bacterium]